MFGNNPLRPPVHGTGEVLEVVEIFSTLQGEGPFAGWPAVFVRLGGCNLACAFCDTEFEQFSSLSLAEIMRQIHGAAVNGVGSRVRSLVVITGGEPFRQPIGQLCETLVAEGFSVQIETNGTLFREIPKEVAIICSPKSGTHGYHRVRDDLLMRAKALKFIISAEDPRYNHVPEVGQSTYNIPVYVQPMDCQNAKLNFKNQEYAVKLAKEQGYLLSLQLHKTLGIP